MRKVAIVVDSAGDIPSDVCARLNIRVLPAFINFGDESFADDGKAITRSEFYQRLAQVSQLPTTSAPPPGLGEAIFREVLQDAEHIIAISVASKLSSIHSGMVLAAQKASSDRITVIDSTTLSMGEGWIAVAAAEAAAQGASLEDIHKLIEEMRPCVRVWAVLDTLDYVRMSGRVSWLRSSLSSMLNIKPIIAVRHNEVISETRVRTFSKAVEKLVELAQTQVPLERLAVMHSNDEAKARHLLGLLQRIAPADHTLVVDVTPVVGTHVGPGGVGIATVRAAS